MMTMDSAARAIDAMLHRGRAEERDGGVWLDDLAVGYVTELAGEVAEATWRAQDAEESEKNARFELNDANDMLLKYDRVIRAVHTLIDSEADDADVIRGVCDVVEQCRNWPVVKG